MAVTAITLWAAYIVLDALLIVYVSAVLAIGFSPIVRGIERQKMLPIGSRRFPRWFAILFLYLAILGAAGFAIFLILPPLVDQAQSLWANAPQMFEKGQGFLIQKGWLKEHLTIRQAVEIAPGTGGDAVNKAASALPTSPAASSASSRS